MSQKNEFRLAAGLVAQKLDATLEGAVDLGTSTEAYAVIILHYVSDVLVTVFGVTPDVIAAHAATPAGTCDPSSVPDLSLLIRKDGRQRAPSAGLHFRRTIIID